MQEHNADTLEEVMSLIQLLIKDATAHSMVAVLLRAAHFVRYLIKINFLALLSRTDVSFLDQHAGRASN